MIPFWQSLASLRRDWLHSLISRVNPRRTPLTQRVLFQCRKCSHVFSAKGLHMRKKNACPFCRPGGRLCPLNLRHRCTWCVERTLASPNLRTENGLPFHQVIVENALDIRRFSARKVTIRCWEPGCLHTYENRAKDVGTRSCRYCHAGRLCPKFLQTPTQRSCPQCYDRSFASCRIRTSRGTPVQQLYRGHLDLKKLSRYSHRKLPWHCEECSREFMQTLRNVERGTWCSECPPKGRKTEHKVWLYVRERFPEAVWQFKPDWLCTRWVMWSPKLGRIVRGKYPYAYDFCLKDGICLEIDGNQHREQVSNWQSPLLTQLRDAYKDRCARRNGWRVLRLHQGKVLRDQFDWRRAIDKALAECPAQKN